MKRVAPGIAVVLILVRAALILAQVPDFSGTWKLDPNQSRINAGAGLGGLIAAGAPGTLHITQPANGTLAVESQINESHSRIYRPGGKTSTPVAQTGTITMASRWDGRRLINEGTQVLPSGASTAMTEIFALSTDGRTLTIDVTAADSVSTFVYTRSLAVEPCKSWPTPCKTFGPGGK